MPQQLPSLNALRAFEAAARHLSFSKAAEELHVTTAAISHQIKGLEDYLGVQLFHRLNRGLALTEAAQLCLPKLQEGFECLAEAVAQIRGHDERNILSIGVAPFFGAKWLVPRLQRFAALHPEIELQITASMSFVDKRNAPGAMPGSCPSHGTDIAIRFGTDHYPDCRTDKLLSVSAVPMCSPRFLEQDPPLREPGDLRHYTLLHDDTDYDGRPEWGAWLKAAGIEGIDASRGSHFNHVSLALEAAIEGQGVVLSIKALAESDLAAGRLVIPFDVSMPLRSAYYVVTPEASAELPRVLAFREWLLNEAGQNRDRAVSQHREAEVCS